MGFREKIAAAKGTDFLTAGIPSEEIAGIVREARLWAHDYREALEHTGPGKKTEASNSARSEAGQGQRS